MNLEGQSGEYMKKDPIIVNPQTNLTQVASLMAKNDKDVVVIKDDEGIIRGLVTANDLFQAMVSSVLGKDLLEQIPRDLRDVQVSELMRATKAEEFMEVCGLTGTNVCISLGPEDKVANAIRVMALAGIDHILILGAEGVIGTISDKDLVKVFLD
jgi:CBS domain-containing protein